MGGTPYPGIPTNQLFEELRRGYRMPKPEYCPSEIYDVMGWCWNESPELRPTFERLVQHFAQLILKKSEVVEYGNLRENSGNF